MTTPARGFNPEASVEEIADGFTTLRDEYKRLAEQHHRLELKLCVTSRECAVLRKLLSENLPDQTIPRTDFEEPTLEPSRNLDEWLERKVKNDQNKQGILDKVRKAEVALFRTRGWLVRRKSRDSNVAQEEGRPTIQTPHELDMEQDFTTAGTPGRLGCPFAAMAGKNQNHSAEQKNSLPTPHSSGSHLMPNGKLSEQPSTRNPTNGEVHNGSCLASSVADGPICPIRFMSDHPPEEIAQYFEEHKHELPKSHELCVKRFQDNAQSIKELDEKYGNLVSMIQGLGKKHQPMLPEEPNPDANEIENDEVKSNRRVKKWAKGVGEEISDEADPPMENPNGIPPSDTEGNEDRIQRFDRPLKEIRVGESPSRPWGVPIPSRYFDRNEAEEPTSPAAPPAAENLNGTGSKSNVASQGSDSPLEEKKAAQTEDVKSPANGQVVASRVRAPVQPKVKLPAHLTSFLDQLAKDATPPRAPGERPPEEPDEEKAGPAIINHGVAIVSNTASLQKEQNGGKIPTITNYGTLVFGYDEFEARKLVAEALQVKDKAAAK